MRQRILWVMRGSPGQHRALLVVGLSAALGWSMLNCEGMCQFSDTVRADWLWDIEQDSQSNTTQSPPKLVDVMVPSVDG